MLLKEPSWINAACIVLDVIAVTTPFVPAGAGTQIGKRMFSTRNDLRDIIVHEELHHRWWKRGIYGDHHPK